MATWISVSRGLPETLSSIWYFNSKGKKDSRSEPHLLMATFWRRFSFITAGKHLQKFPDLLFYLKNKGRNLWKIKQIKIDWTDSRCCWFTEEFRTLHLVAILFADTTALVVTTYTQAAHIMKLFLYLVSCDKYEQLDFELLALRFVIRNINDDVWGLFTSQFTFLSDERWEEAICVVRLGIIL